MIEKLGLFSGEVSPTDMKLAVKINELVDAVNELGTTRKALDVAKDKLDTVRQYHRGTAVIRPDDIAAYCDRAIEQITALEQKD